MKRIGITGGIGSGKSTVCDLWEQEGAFVINADALAKEVMTHNVAIKKALCSAFGEKSYHADGSLNRTFLAEEAFKKGRVEELNAIVHPHIPAEAENLMQTAEKRGYEVGVYEAALLLRDGRPSYLDALVLVLAPEKERIAWVQHRDDTEREKVTQRMEKQQDFSALTHLADAVISNDGSLEQLRTRALEVYNDLRV